MKIIAYLKPSCGWSNGVRAILKKYNLNYEEKDIVNNTSFFLEMIEKSNQNLSPCIIINEVMLPDISGEELENYMLTNNLVKPNKVIVDVPINQSCSKKNK